MTRSSNLRIAFERATICNAAKDLKLISSNSRTSEDPIFLSFDSPYSDYRPLHVFFQNYFCSRLHVPILYPFRHYFLPQYLEKTRYPISLLNKVVDLLIQEKKCGENFPQKRTNKIIFEQLSSGKNELPILPSSTSPFLSSLLFLNQRYSQLEVMNFNELSSNSVSYIHKLAHIISPRLITSSSSSFSPSSSLDEEKNEIILLLVTSSYEELFLNFLCHLEKLTFTSSTLFLVITPHDRIEEIALKYQKTVVFKVTSKDIQSLFPYISTTRIQKMFTSTGSDFGEILYQQLIFLRSITAFYLLKYFYNTSVIIADIDTIWVNNPLLFIPPQQREEEKRETHQFDLRVTYDGAEEICGCYLYLYSTNKTLYFWSDVISRHFLLIKESYEYRQQKQQWNDDSPPLGDGDGDAPPDDDVTMINLFDSEQKILSKIILQEINGQGEGEGEYPVKLEIFFHDKRSFPNGGDYFVSGIASMNSSSSSTLPFSSSSEGISENDQQSPPPLAIIHNNFIIGAIAKKIRFQRHNLWNVFYDDETLHDFICLDSMEILSFYSKILSLSSSSHEIIPSLHLIYPIHNEIITTTRMKLMFMTERNTNLPPLSSSSSSSSSALTHGKVWLSRSPDYVLFSYQYGFVVADVTLVDPKVVHFSIIADQSSQVHLTGDVGVNPQGHRNSLLPYNQVGELEDSVTQYFTTLSSQDTLRLEKYHQMSPFHDESHEGSMRRRTEVCPVNLDLTSKYIFSIKVLSFYRVKSLERLLESLMSAYYVHNTTGSASIVVELCIHVDHPNQNTTVEQVHPLLSLPHLPFPFSPPSFHL
jgi:hypothetical protein